MPVQTLISAVGVARIVRPEKSYRPPGFDDCWILVTSDCMTPLWVSFGPQTLKNLARPTMATSLAANHVVHHAAIHHVLASTVGIEGRNTARAVAL